MLDQQVVIVQQDLSTFRFKKDLRKIEAIESLERIGIFLPMNELELYHGRVPNGEEGEWSVKSDFSNSAIIQGIGM